MNVVHGIVGWGFFMPAWDRRKNILYGSGSARVISETKPTPECEASGTECYGS